MAEIAKKTIVDTSKLNAIEVLYGADRSVASLVAELAMGEFLDNAVVIGQMPKDAGRVVLRPVTIQAVIDTLLKEDQLISPVATFVSNFVDRVLSRVKSHKGL